MTNLDHHDAREIGVGAVVLDDATIGRQVREWASLLNSARCGVQRALGLQRSANPGGPTCA